MLLLKNNFNHIGIADTLKSSHQLHQKIRSYLEEKLDLIIDTDARLIFNSNTYSSKQTRSGIDNIKYSDNKLRVLWKIKINLR